MPNKDELLRQYRTMMVIRRFEEGAEEAYMRAIELDRFTLLKSLGGHRSAPRGQSTILSLASQRACHHGEEEREGQLRAETDP